MAWSDEYWKGTAVQDFCAKPCLVKDIHVCQQLRAGEFSPLNETGAFCQPKAHVTCNQPDTAYHDLCGYFLGSSPDSYVNEVRGVRVRVHARTHACVYVCRYLCSHLCTYICICMYVYETTCHVFIRPCIHNM